MGAEVNIKILAVLVLATLKLSAQTKVEAEDYIKSGNVTTEASDSNEWR